MASKRASSGRTSEVKDPVIQETIDLFEEIEDHSHRLSDWEKGFITSTQERFYGVGNKKGTPLTELQFETLKKIADKVCH